MGRQGDMKESCGLRMGKPKDEKDAKTERKQSAGEDEIARRVFLVFGYVFKLLGESPFPAIPFHQQNCW